MSWSWLSQPSLSSNLRICIWHMAWSCKPTQGGLRWVGKAKAHQSTVPHAVLWISLSTQLAILTRCHKAWYVAWAVTIYIDTRVQSSLLLSSHFDRNACFGGVSCVYTWNLYKLFLFLGCVNIYLSITFDLGYSSLCRKLHHLGVFVTQPINPMRCVRYP